MAIEDCVLRGGRFVLPRDILEGGALVLRGGRVHAVLEAGDKLPKDLPRRDLGRAWVTPGLVELHIHGCGGVDFASLGALPGSRDALMRARAFLRSRGITTFAPTVIARESSVASLAAAVEEAGLSREELPGIYVEGPFVNPARRGAIPPDALSDPDTRLLGRLINLARGRMAMMTLAPELPGYREILARLEAVGVLPCLGHSDCNIDRITLPSGRYSITHLFNGMSGFSHKEPGLAMLPFLDRRPFVELNPDGAHVNDAALRICATSLDPERLALISDAAAPAGLPDGTYGAGAEALASGPEILVSGPEILVSGADGVRAAGSGILVGGRLLAPDLLRRWIKATGASVPNAVRMLSLTPAQALGLEARRGAIAPGLDAALVVWKGDFEAVEEIIE
jgi:N-acetylglucosamine-6-phosphate deacetylase